MVIRPFQKIIAIRDNIREKLAYQVAVAHLVQVGFISEEDGWAFINEYHGNVVLTYNQK